ncbi:MAG: T9SS type A sorting domain-containing protein [Flavobacteriales bacterium]
MKRTLLLGCALAAAYLTNAQACSDVFISEYVEGTFNNKAIELHNPTNVAIDLGAGQYKMGRQRNGAGDPMLLDITGIIPAHGTRVFVLDKQDPDGVDLETPVDADLAAVADTFVNPIYVEANSPMYFNGDDAFVLGKGDATLLDIFGKLFEDPGDGWYVPGDPNTAWWTVDNTMYRKNTIQQGVAANPAVFDPSLEWDSLPANTFDHLGWHDCVCGAEFVKEEKQANEFTLFPNPLTDGQFALKSDAAIKSLTILSTDGKIIFAQQMQNNTTNTNVALPEAEAGIYLVEVEFADGTISHRKIIAK